MHHCPVFHIFLPPAAMPLLQLERETSKASALRVSTNQLKCPSRREFTFASFRTGVTPPILHHISILMGLRCTTFLQYTYV